MHLYHLNISISFHKPCRLNQIQLWDLLKCALVTCMNAYILCITVGSCKLNTDMSSAATWDVQSTLNPWFQTKLSYIQLLTVISVPFSLCAVCKISVFIWKKIWFIMCTNLPDYWVPCCCSVYFLLFIFLKCLYL